MTRSPRPTKDQGAGASATPSGSRASTEPCSTVSALTGFDPSRIPALVADMRSIADCDARAGEPLGKALRRGAEAIAHLFDALDRIANEEDVIADFDGFYLRDIARGAIWRDYAAAAMSASGQDAQRLEAQPASAVPERQTPQSPPLSQGDE